MNGNNPLKYLNYEGIFRRPRLWSNDELEKFAHLFDGVVINVSAWKDMDKSIGSYWQYISGDYDTGVEYKKYFKNAKEYWISNYKQHRDDYLEYSDIDSKNFEISLDLESIISPELKRKFDVVFNHTVLEHIFDIFKAFENLCLMSNDVVILVVPFVQKVHDYQGDYRDYWRFTPFVIDKLFEKNGYSVLYCSSSNLIQASVYNFYIASRKPEKWEKHFKVQSIEEQIQQMNMGEDIFPIAKGQLLLERGLRKIVKVFKQG